MRACAMLAVLFAVPLTTAADEKDKPAVKEIATKELKVAFPAKAGKATEPTTVSSAEELAKNPILKDAADAIKKTVDFEKQKLLVFAWAGSGQDTVTLSIGSEGGKSIVYGEYLRGRTRDLRQHVRLFAVPKELKVVIDGGK